MSQPASPHNPYLSGRLTLVFLRTAAPLVLFMTVSGLYTVVDALILGRFAGPKALTAVTLMFPVMMLMVALQTMVSAGMASILARQIGAGDLAGAEATLHAAHRLAGGICLVLMAALAAFGEPLARLLAGGDAEIARMGYVFTAIMVVFSPMAFFLGVQGDALRSEGRVGLMAAVAIAVTLLNMVFNAVLIGGFGLGVAGSAAGTVAAQAVAVAAVAVLRLTGRTPLPLLPRAGGASLRAWRGMLALGAPPSLGFLGISLTSALVIADIQIWVPGDTAATVAAYGVITRIFTFAFLPLMGASMACQSIAGNNFGAGLGHRVRGTLGIGLLFALGYAVLFEAAFVLLPGPIGRLFLDDHAVVAEVARIMPILGITYALSAPLMIVGGYYQALGMAASAAVLNLARTYLISLPLLALLPKALGERGIWLATPFGDLLMLAVTAALLIWNARRNGLAWGLLPAARVPG